MSEKEQCKICVVPKDFYGVYTEMLRNIYDLVKNIYCLPAKDLTFYSIDKDVLNLRKGIFSFSVNLKYTDSEGKNGD